MIYLKVIRHIVLFILLIQLQKAAAQPLSQQLARTAMDLWKDSFLLPGDKAAKWRYDQGVILKGIEGIWRSTGDGEWFRYIQKSMDFYVREDGSIRGYRPDEYNIDHLNNGKLLLLLYQVTGKEKYRQAVMQLRNQLRTHPRTSEGGFWHKKIYPSQMWLDGLYMGQPFYAEYSRLFGEDSAFNDITRQFVLMEKHARDEKSGLLYHGWDESRSQRWANSATGRSPHVWGRALGWFGMALVDALEQFPARHPGRDSLLGILNRFARAVTKVQDPATGLWMDIPNLPLEKGNYPEASASCMLVYTLAKGVRLGYLPLPYRKAAEKGYQGIQRQFLKKDGDRLHLAGTVAVSGLGGNPYRDGSFAYYMSEPVIVDDPKGVGAFIKAAVEMEKGTTSIKEKKGTVLLDRFYNNEWKEGANGRMVRYHYTWEDEANSGFSFLGGLFRDAGFSTRSIDVEPTQKNLKGADVFVLVDPDTDKETKAPNAISEKTGKVLEDWVRQGGVLILLGNDAGNTDLLGLNRLSARFGIRFNEDNFNLVEGNRFEQGEVVVAPGNPVFSTGGRLYIKELATLTLRPPAQPLVIKEGKVIMATASLGKGIVFALGDPWLYNEYVDGRKLPTDFTNFRAATELVRWAAAQAKTK
jgi:unsaturated rhamnogalacturonyl hydrolase